ncbi:hypothetical protein DL96DRAFT_1591698 [Flagelloscypha sp. PMI_526]|nr:hypothetical protein DL96DRAFT_1591698 [Flagelloscypha sp. PMI_526]
MPVRQTLDEPSARDPTTLSARRNNATDSTPLRRSVLDAFTELGALDENSYIADWIFNDTALTVEELEASYKNRVRFLAPKPEVAPAEDAPPAVADKVDEEERSSSAFMRLLRVRRKSQDPEGKKKKKKRSSSVGGKKREENGYDTDEGYVSSSSLRQRSQRILGSLSRKPKPAKDETSPPVSKESSAKPSSSDRPEPAPESGEPVVQKPADEVAGSPAAPPVSEPEPATEASIPDSTPAAPTAPEDVVSSPLPTDDIPTTPAIPDAPKAEDTPIEANPPDTVTDEPSTPEPSIDASESAKVASAEAPATPPLDANAPEHTSAETEAHPQSATETAPASAPVEGQAQPTTETTTPAAVPVEAPSEAPSTSSPPASPAQTKSRPPSRRWSSFFSTKSFRQRRASTSGASVAPSITKQASADIKPDAPVSSAAQDAPEVSSATDGETAEEGDATWETMSKSDAKSLDLLALSPKQKAPKPVNIFVRGSRKAKRLSLSW